MTDNLRDGFLALMRDAIHTNAPKDGGPSAAELSDDAVLATLISDLNLESLAKMELVMNIEAESGVLLDEALVQRAKTVADLWQAVLHPKPS